MLQKNWMELIKPSKMDVNVDIDSNKKGILIAEPLERGFGLSIGAEILAVMLFSGMISRVGFGYLSDKIGPVYTLFIGSLLQMLSLVFFLPFDSQLSLYIVSLMFGLSQGGIVPAYAMIIRKYLPIEQDG